MLCRVATKSAGKVSVIFSIATLRRLLLHSEYAGFK